METSEIELAELHAAMMRARAMGFERTAEAMQRVLDEMMMSTNGLQSATDTDRTELETSS